jgi:hypothetical protein
MTSPKVRRRRAQSDSPRFHWFQGASVRELYNQLSAAGPDTVILEVHQSGDKMTFQVVNQGGAQAQASPNPSINDSRVCPPICH